jgi:hypothetical protein
MEWLCTCVWLNQEDNKYHVIFNGMEYGQLIFKKIELEVSKKFKEGDKYKFSYIADNISN